jgi:hypothetical protein
MAKANKENVQALRNAARKLRSQERYEWGHMGRCNCGYLAKEITKLSDAEIHQLAMEKAGDWRDQLREYCPQSGIAMDVIIDIMVDAGFTTAELMQLERLENPEILNKIGKNNFLNYNNSSDVALYLEAWAALLEGNLINKDIAVEKEADRSSQLMYV